VPADRALEAQSAPSVSERSERGPLTVGQVLAGAHKIVGVLGARGMRVVYDAHDLLLDRMD
jgi:hypothetical protein